MPSSPIRQRFIAAATRPFEDNAEMHLSASRWIEDHASTEDTSAMELATSRWEKVDARGHHASWRWIIPSLALPISFLVAGLNAGDLYRHFIWFKAALRDFADPPEGSRERTLRHLPPDRKRLIPPGIREGGHLASSQALLEASPENPVFFSYHAASHLASTSGLPSGFLQKARAIGPDNAWFTLLAAGAEAKGSFTQKNGIWEIKDPAAVARSLDLIHQAAGQDRCEPHAAELLRLRLGMVPLGSFPDRMDSVTTLSALPSIPAVSNSNIWGVISASAAAAAESGDAAAFRRISGDAEKFLHHLSRTSVTTLLNEVIIWGTTFALSAELAKSAEKLSLPDERERWKGLSNRLAKSKAARAGNINASKSEETPLPLLASGFQIVATAATKRPPPIDRERLLPLIHMEHAQLALFTTCAAWAAMVLIAFAIALYPLRVSRLHRGFARREIILLDWRDALWIAGAGIVLPAAYVTGINCLTPLGDHHRPISASDLLLPTAHILGLCLLWLTLTPQVIRWRLVRRARVTGFRALPWLDHLATLAALAFVPLIGWTALSGSRAQWWDELLFKLEFWNFPSPASPTTPTLFWITSSLFGVALLLILARVILALLAPARHRVHQAASSMILATALSATVALMALSIPACESLTRYWLKQDTLAKVTPSIPGFSAYEYEVALQAREELRELLGPLAR